MSNSAFRLNQGETDAFAIGFGRVLDSGDDLQAPITVTVWEQTGEKTYTEKTPDFSVSAEAVNTAVVTDEKGFDHRVGAALEFRLAADSVAIGDYLIRAEADTTGGNHKVGEADLRVIGPPKP